MFRFTAVARKISPFCLYVKEQHASSTKRLTMKAIGQRYHKLAPAQKAALVRRAKAYTSPNAKKWVAFRNANMKQFSSLSPAKRMSKISKLYKAQRTKAAKPAKATKSASDKVKKVAKAAKAAKH